MGQLPQAVSRNHFLVAVEFMASCFFGASRREREKEREREREPFGPSL